MSSEERVLPWVISATDTEEEKGGCPWTSNLPNPGCALEFEKGEPFKNTDAWAPHPETSVQFICGTAQALSFF